MHLVNKLNRTKEWVILVIDEEQSDRLSHMFRAGGLLILNKIDLLLYVKFDVERCIKYARQINPQIKFLQVSATGKIYLCKISKFFAF
ncbi:MAG TPA: GTP-binding protein [Pyrinomonadaceae bacterium]